MNTPGLLIVISGPSGAGKGTLCNLIKKEFPNIYYSISATTRSSRQGERHGVDYLFMSREEFLELREANGFLEWAEVYGNFYGTPRSKVEENIAEGKDVILEIDIQGALHVKKQYPEGVFIFIVPPSIRELKRRIESRGQDSPEDISKRLKSAHTELAYVSEYDYVIVNDKIETAIAKLKSIITAEKCRPQRRKINFE
ncbi:guanylate kinase [Desulfitibacter alkalitolerans]|uniref:guanylate kinase n=1 Tax=Desulfitibacter alkalitolerans TaxID=264641 RepID=UPI0004879AAB